MKFTKMHGCGNDYVYVNLFEEKIADPAKVSIAVSDRHFGIGSDGLITIGPSDIADFRMRIYNADGSSSPLRILSSCIPQPRGSRCRGSTRSSLNMYSRVGSFSSARFDRLKDAMRQRSRWDRCRIFHMN